MRERLGSWLLNIALWLLEPYWQPYIAEDLLYSMEEQLAYDEASLELDDMLAKITPENKHSEIKW